MSTTQSSLVKSNRAFMALEDMGAKLRFVSVNTGRVHGPHQPLEHLRSELARLSGYHAREPRRFDRVGTWDEAVDRFALRVQIAEA